MGRLDIVNLQFSDFPRFFPIFNLNVRISLTTGATASIAGTLVFLQIYGQTAVACFGDNPVAKIRQPSG